MGPRWCDGRFTLQESTCQPQIKAMKTGRIGGWAFLWTATGGCGDSLGDNVDSGETPQFAAEGIEPVVSPIQRMTVRTDALLYRRANPGAGGPL